MGKLEDWTLIKTEAQKDNYLPLVTKRFRLPNGIEKSFTCVDKVEYVTIIMVTSDDKIVVAKQYRPGPEKILLDPPGGNIEKGQSPMDAAMAEIQEETGYTFEKIEYINSTYVDPYDVRKRHTFVATGCKKAQDQNPDENEFIEVVEIPIAEYIEILKDGTQTCDSASIYPAFIYLGYLKFSL